MEKRKVCVSPTAQLAERDHAGNSANSTISTWRLCQLGTSTLPMATSSQSSSRWRQGAGRTVCPHLQLCFLFASKNLEPFIAVTTANSLRPSVFTLVSRTTEVFFYYSSTEKCSLASVRAPSTVQSHSKRWTVSQRASHKEWLDWYFTVQRKEGRSDETVKSTREEVVPPLICTYFSEPGKLEASLHLELRKSHLQKAIQTI